MSEDLIRILDGETKEQAIARWWVEHGLDYEQAQAKRRETYAKQRAEEMAVVAAFNERTQPCPDSEA